MCLKVSGLRGQNLLIILKGGDLHDHVMSMGSFIRYEENSYWNNLDLLIILH